MQQTARTDTLKTESRSGLVSLGAGIYTNADTGGNRVRIENQALGVIIDSFGDHYWVALQDGSTVMVHHASCKKV